MEHLGTNYHGTNYHKNCPNQHKNSHKRVLCIFFNYILHCIYSGKILKQVESKCLCGSKIKTDCRNNLQIYKVKLLLSICAWTKTKLQFSIYATAGTLFKWLNQHNLLFHKHVFMAFNCSINLSFRTNIVYPAVAHQCYYTSIISNLITLSSLTDQMSLP